MKVIGLLAAMVLAGPVAAQDWTGAYVGGSVGWGDTTVNDNYDSTVKFDFGADGGLAGLALGYNLQSGSVVYGVEASLSFGTLKGSGECLPSTCIGSGTAPTAKIDQMAMLRARLGIADADRLYYATLGVARAEGLVDDPVQGGQDSQQHNGWVAGVGIDWAMSDRMTVGAEYIYGRFEDIDYALVSTPDVIGFNTQELRLTAKLRF